MSRLQPLERELGRLRQALATWETRASGSPDPAQVTQAGLDALGVTALLMLLLQSLRGQLASELTAWHDTLTSEGGTGCGS